MEFSTGSKTALPDKIICQNCGQVLEHNRQTALSNAIASLSCLLQEASIEKGIGFYVSCEVEPSAWAQDPDMFA